MTRSRMYVEEFPAKGPLTAEIAEDLAFVPGVSRSSITISSNGRSVHAPVLPAAWDILRIDSGTMVTVTAANGLGDEDRLAIRQFVDRFHALTDTPSTRSAARAADAPDGVGKRMFRLRGCGGRAATPRGSRPS
ncbi:hypothetical protein IU479_14190 [Nocardia abscessus]|uniref:hypothetical protein n=1 Tax=Nocardia TaxID=1817 RepID=UPI00189577A6|nr:MULTISPECIES: hypothetical protein [Nocardia]MBF6219261.1 hypothetical protein [Nocardia abscessus]MDE1669156.1 hypothetical protein [Nocardia gipuzkoensis]